MFDYIEAGIVYIAECIFEHDTIVIFLQKRKVVLREFSLRDWYCTVKNSGTNE
jgi:hypothetical protein